MHRHSYLLSQYAQLFHGSRAEGIAGSQQRIHLLLLLEHLGQFSAHGGLTGTIESGHKDDGGMSLETHVGGLPSHEQSQFVMHYLDHQLLWLDGCEHVLSQCLLLYRVGECLGHLIVHIGIKEGPTHILECLGNVNLGDFSFTFQDLERPFEAFAQILKHILCVCFYKISCFNNEFSRNPVSASMLP